jgi:hypothetical protein
MMDNLPPVTLLETDATRNGIFRHRMIFHRVSWETPKEGSGTPSGDCKIEAEFMSGGLG